MGALALMATLLLSAIRPLQSGPTEQPLVVTGPKVIFFHPTKTEVDSVIRNGGLEITDILDDYDFASGRAAYYLSMITIGVEFTESRVILVKLSRNRVRRIDRNHLTDPVGMVLTDGEQEPRLIAGPRDDAQLISEINSFFHID